MRVLYIIPARGGSKGLPGKNIQPLGGKPLIAWTIDAVMTAKQKGTVLVSTDSEEIAAVARKHGALVPFLRPEELSTDAAASMDVVYHAMDWYSKKEGPCDVVVLLQPTSPLRTAGDIDAALDLYSKRKAVSVVSVCEADHHPLWSNTLPPDGSMKDFIRPEIKGKNRQQLPQYYRLNGAIYISAWDKISQYKSFISDESIAYIMSRENSADIDSSLDLILAEIILRNKK